MIWNGQRVFEDNALVSSVSEEINSACSEESGAVSREDRQEVARAVASFVARECPAPSVASEYLVLLAARALWAVGEEGAARRLIALKGAELGFSKSYADAAFAPDMSLPVWQAMMTLRAVRYSALFDSARGPVWVLDLERAAALERDRLEMTVFCLMSAVLEEIAPLWDQVKGRGTLGLRHVNAVASSVIKKPRSSRKTESLVTEIRARCVEKLQSLQRTRRWERAPDVLSLDG
ncbi:hypothetical protein ACFLQR_01095 [Verrucomicrobiota bacterium]